MQKKHVAIAIFLLGFNLYYPSLQYGFLLDDIKQIVHNTTVHSLINFPRFFTESTFFSGGSEKLSGAFYRPMMMLMYSIIISVSGVAPVGFHLFQITLHCLNAFLIFLIFSKHLPHQISLFSALIFLLHPINVETVVYIADLQDILFVFFGLFSLVYIQTRIRLKQFRTLILFFLVLSSLMSKETGLVFIPILGFYVYLFAHHQLKKVVRPLVLALILYLFLKTGAVSMMPVENPAIPSMAWVDRVILIPSVINHYLEAYIFPGKLTLFAIWNSPSPITELIPLVIFIGSLIMITSAIKKNKHKPLWRYFLVWLAFGMAFHSQLIPLAATVADRWFYLPQIGLLGLLAAGATYVIPEKRLHYLMIPALIIFPLLMFQSRHLLSFWESELTLVSKAYEDNPDNHLLTNSLGFNYLNHNRLELAEVYFDKTVQLSPGWGSAWNNLGYTYYRQGKIGQAQTALYESINLSKSHLAYANLVQLMIDQSQWLAAKELVLDGLTYYPLNPQLWYFLSVTNDKLGDVLGSQAAYTKFHQYSGK
jgi:protein O-mannosyl-transferase